MLENEIVKRFVKYLIKVKKIDKNKIVLEQPYCGSRVDLLYKQDGLLIGVEFKRFDFLGVLRQANNLRFSFNKVFICYLKPKNDENFKKKLDICKRREIGLIIFDENSKRFETLYEPNEREIVLHIFVSKNKNNYRLVDYLG